MSELDTAVNAVEDAINAIKRLGESKKTNAMVRKLTVVSAELQAELTRERVMAELPKKATTKTE